MGIDAIRAKRQWIGVTCLAASILLVLFVRYCNRGSRQQLPMYVMVAVEGEVRNPGFYILERPSATIAHAVSAAGGCKNKRVMEASNSLLWSREAQKGDLLDVKCPESGTATVEIKPMPAAALITLGMKLDLNRVTEDDLSLVPGMRDDFSRFIMERRAERPWRSLEELVEISGVGPKTVEKWKGYLEVGK